MVGDFTWWAKYYGVIQPETKEQINAGEMSLWTNIETTWCATGISFLAKECNLSKWHNPSSVCIHPAWQSVPDQFSDSLSCTSVRSTELNGIIGRLSGFLGRCSSVPWYRSVVWNLDLAPAPHCTHPFMEGECLSCWRQQRLRANSTAIELTQAHTSEQTPDDAHALVLTPGITFVTLHPPFCPLHLLWLHCRRDALSFITHPSLHPYTTSILHLCSSTIKRLLLAILPAILPFWETYNAHKPSSRVAERLQGHCKCSSTLSRVLLLCNHLPFGLLHCHRMQPIYLYGPSFCFSPCCLTTGLEMCSQSEIQ